MPNYRRANIKGGTYFFTVVTHQRQKLLIDEDVRNALREGIKKTRVTFPFQILAWVLLPDHLHCIWSLPEGDADFARRWGMIKRHVSQHCANHLKTNEGLNLSRIKRNESSLWQRRYWEHQIRDESDLIKHINYIHWNPLKHGLVDQVSDWPYSTFHRFVADGVYPKNWCGNEETERDTAGFGE